MKKVIEQVLQFRDEREWKQFHTPDNLAKCISIEAGELLECFQWSPNYELQAVKDELADVMTYCLLMADSLNLDVNEIILEKLEKNKQKYPADKCRGNSKKYTEL